MHYPYLLKLKQGGILIQNPFLNRHPPYKVLLHNLGDLVLGNIGVNHPLLPRGDNCDHRLHPAQSDARCPEHNDIG
ncbi:hypothetical protein ES703_54127 [subsurface metagenome]